MNNIRFANVIIYKRLGRCHLRTCVTVYLDYRNCNIENICSNSIKNLGTFHPVYNKTKKILRDVESIKCQLFCTKSDKENDRFTKHKDLVKNELKAYLVQNKEKLKDTEDRIKQRGSDILQDIKETRDKVKEKVEEVIIKENIYTIPNLLCVSRILLSPYLGMLIVQSNFDFALAILGIAAFTDLLDGWIARTWESQSSKMGSFLDPMADKVLIATLFLTLTYANLIPIALTSMIIARDVVLVAAGFVIRYKSLPPPRTLSRYFDVSHATAQLAPTFISKVNTGVQLLLVGSTLAAPVFHYVGHPALECLWYVTGTTTIAAGLSYIISKNTYRFLNKTSSKTSK